MGESLYISGEDPFKVEIVGGTRVSALLVELGGTAVEPTMGDTAVRVTGEVLAVFERLYCPEIVVDSRHRMHQKQG